MSDTKVISKSNGTQDVDYYENDPLQQVIESESQKQEEHNMQFNLTDNELYLIMSMDRIQAVIYILIKCLENEKKNFDGEPNYDVYVQIGNIITESRKFYFKISSLKERMLELRKIQI